MYNAQKPNNPFTQHPQNPIESTFTYLVGEM
jgi:hypothetical protein